MPVFNLSTENASMQGKQKGDIMTHCPVDECGKRLTLRGLNGHLRMKHGWDKEKAAAYSAEVRSNPDVVREIPSETRDESKKGLFALLDSLQEIKEKREQLKELKNSGVLSYGVAKSLDGQLDREQKELQEEIETFAEMDNPRGWKERLRSLLYDEDLE